MGRFGSARTIEDDKDEYCFNKGVLVVLGPEFKIAEIWELDVNQIKTMEKEAKNRKKENGKNKNLWGLNLSTFINNDNVT